VLARIFPVRRGLYEDYLANWWCVTSLAIKWKQLASNALLMRVCATATLAAAAPSMVQQIRAPSRRGLLLALANSGYAFFMFSYQVMTAIRGGNATDYGHVHVHSDACACNTARQRSCPVVMSNAGVNLGGIWSQ
jgi:hypothetical protein